MGQKTNPIGLRLGIIKTWDSRWFARREYAELLKEDLLLRKYLKNRLAKEGVPKILIQRTAKMTNKKLLKDLEAEYAALNPPPSWSPISTNTPATNGAWQFQDSQATNFSQRFYRLKLAP